MAPDRILNLLLVKEVLAILLIFRNWARMAIDLARSDGSIPISRL